MAKTQKSQLKYEIKFNVISIKLHQK